ncbi:hypothetical protein [Nocardioides sp.]|uniref:hypothetical protein n=1 Tax=Nocardioides sp. TaxID=35761 RepID=UPI0039E399AA
MAVEDERNWRRFGPDSAERAALLALSEHLGVPLRPRAVELSPGTMFEIEGVDPDGRHLLQVVVNRGTYTSQKRNKVLADMFKLLWLKATRFPDCRVGLLLNENTSEAFKPRSWTFLAAQELGFDLYVLADDGTVTRHN